MPEPLPEPPAPAPRPEPPPPEAGGLAPDPVPAREGEELAAELLLAAADDVGLAPVGLATGLGLAAAAAGGVRAPFEAAPAGLDFTALELSAAALRGALVEGDALAGGESLAGGEALAGDEPLPEEDPLAGGVDARAASAAGGVSVAGVPGAAEAA